MTRRSVLDLPLLLFALMGLLSGWTPASGGSTGCTADEPDPPPPPLPDGFLLGANYPWLNYGNDFGANTWGAYGISTQAGTVEADLTALAGAGAPVARWFLLTDGRASPEFGVDGLPTGLDPLVFQDLDAALAAAEAAGVSLVPVLLDFYWGASPSWVAGVQLGGHAAVLEQSEARAVLLETTLIPLLERYGGEPNILAWEVINEPEWAMDGYGEEWLGDTVSGEAMRAFVAEVAAAVHEYTVHPVTVGSADREWLQTHWLDSDLDVLQYHWYGTPPFTHDAADIGDPRPLILGEFASSGDVQQVLDRAFAAGFKGAWPWSLRADDDASGELLGPLGRWSADHADAVWTGP